MQLVRVFVDPGALDAEFAGEGGGIHQRIACFRSVVGDDQLGDALHDGLHAGTVDGGLYACCWIGVRRFSIEAIHSLSFDRHPPKPATDLQHSVPVDAHDTYSVSSSRPSIDAPHATRPSTEPLRLRTAPRRPNSPSSGEATRIDRDGTLVLKLDGSDRVVRLPGENVESLRLAYAQHVYRQQGATVDRAVVLTGGWQTSKESAYVQATRDQLGIDGQDPDRIERIARRISKRCPHTPSIAYDELRDTAWEPARDPLHLSDLVPHGDISCEHKRATRMIATT